jgi:hypothetical protein
MIVPTKQERKSKLMAMKKKSEESKAILQGKHFCEIPI